jgi:hypothetical protein
MGADDTAIKQVTCFKKISDLVDPHGDLGDNQGLWTSPSQRGEG